MARAAYRVVSITETVITIEDLNGRVSVTNDADAVVAEILSHHGKDKLIHYYDSIGRLDELVHDGRTFMGFAPVQGAPRRCSDD